MSSGFPYAEFYAAYFSGKISGVPSLKWSRPIVRHTISAEQEKNMVNLRFLRPVHVECYVPIKLVGNRLGVGSCGRVGIIFCRETTSQKLDELYQIILRKELYEISFGFDVICCQTVEFRASRSYQSESDKNKLRKFIRPIPNLFPYFRYQIAQA